MSKEIVVLFLTISALSQINIVTAFKPCQTDAGGHIICNQTQYQGNCGSFYDPKSENWCQSEKEGSICCGRTIEDCCTDGGLASVGTIVIFCLLCICCCSILCCRRNSLLWMMIVRNQRQTEQANHPSPTIVIETPEQEQEQIRKEEQILNHLVEHHERNSEVSKDCVVCMERIRNVVLPCGHSLICSDCLQSILRSPTKQCPTCRKHFHIYRTVNYALPSYRSVGSSGDRDSLNELDEDLNTPQTQTTPEQTTIEVTQIETQRETTSDNNNNLTSTDEPTRATNNTQ
eukprot:c12785_g1_i1.p1 GENE.c12785_g1_i1~~c12785_g1_i1.p1  ORF type:complete len:288 (+),score=104.41 c12785_g1_i1:156-1019(+)